MQSDKQTGFSLLEVLAAVAVVVILAVVITIAIKPSANQKIVNNLANSVTPTTAAIGVPYTGSLSGVGSTTATMIGPTWLSLDMLGQLTGTPGGNDFGENNFTLTHTDQNGTTYTASFTISVPKPTLGSVTPPSGFETPPIQGGPSNIVDIVIIPPPNTGDPYKVSYEKVNIQPPDPLNRIPDETSDSSGNLSVQVNAAFGTDYLDHIFIVISPNDPSNSPVRLGPIEAKPEP